MSAPLFFKPMDAWAGDFIPFYWKGEYHLFYLKDYRDEAAHEIGTPWFHIGTRDFVHFTDYGVALPCGRRDEQDLFVYTGSVLEHNGLFHIYYTGDNILLKNQGKPREAIMHATSPDLSHWTKDPANPILFADPARYEMDDWRDPYVFWNADKNEFWMLLATRIKQGPSQRRGCTAVAASRDLVKWEMREPLWTPGLCWVPEVPDLFRWGGWWYLVYSTVADERVLTYYRMSRNIYGPWSAPVNDSFDGSSFYAAKTASDGQRRFAFGWNPTRVGRKDTGDWEWAGSLVVHEVWQDADGALLVKAPAEVINQFSVPVPAVAEPRMGKWDTVGNTLATRVPDSFAWCRLATMPVTCRIDTTVTFAPGTRGCGVILRTDETLDNHYQIRLEPGRNRVVFDRQPRAVDEPIRWERPFSLAPGEPVHLQIIADTSIIVAYINGHVALSARGYDHPGGACGLFVSEGEATFHGTQVTSLAA